MRNQVLGNRYRIQERIGEGGMAFVYVAVDEKLGRRVAIKVLHEHMEKNQDIRKRFQMEAQAISSLDHPNVVKIYDFSGEGLGRLWIVTEVIKGQNLAQYVQQFTGGWLHPIIAACTVREILKALNAAHAHGIVHRDVKPENVMMTVEGQVKLMDFGIAKDLGKSSMTLTGTFMGSPSYMSPEQIRGRDVDLRSDLYSLSVLFYEIVTGRLPFTGQTTHDVVLKIMEGEFTYPRFLVPSLPDQMDAMIVRGMGKDPAHRFQTATDYAQAIDAFLNSMGFDESHIELERFFKDPAAYDERLLRTKFVAAATATQARNNTRPITQQMIAQRPQPTHRISKGSSQRPTKQLTEAPQRASNQAPQRASNQAPQPTSNQAPQRTSNQAPQPTSNQAQQPTSNQAPQRTGNQASQRTGNQASQRAGNQAPQRTSNQAPERTSNQAPQATSKQAPQRTSDQAPQRTSNQAPQRPNNASRAAAPKPTKSAELPPPPPFRAHATWQAHVAQALAPALNPEPTPPPAIQRAPAAQAVRPSPRPPTQILQQPAAYVHQLPAVDPGTPRRQAGYAQRRNVRQMRAPGIRVHRFTITEQSWLNYVFGVALVGLIGIISIWGFVELSSRLAGNTRQRGARVVQIPLKGSNIPSFKPDRGEVKRASKVKNGTPVVVKQTTKKNILATAAPDAPKPAPIRPAKAPKKAKASKWANAQTTVKPVSSLEQSDPNLAIETAEIKKIAKTDDASSPTPPVDASAAQASPTTIPAPAPPTTEAALAEKPEPEPAPAPAPPPPPKVGRAKLTVASDPAAEVFIDGRRVGTTVDQTLNSGWIELKSGKHRLELRRQSYAPYRTAFELAPDEARNLPRINLEPSGNAVAGNSNANAAPIAPKGTALTVRVSAFPAQVTIRNLDNSTTQAFTMKAKSRIVPLESGRYQIKVERKGESKERELNLTGGQGQLTFTADFKGE